MWWNSIRNALETFGAFERMALKVFGFETPIFRGAPPVSYAAPQQDAYSTCDQWQNKLLQ